MPETSFELLRQSGACSEGYRKLARKLGGVEKYGVDTPITILQILESNGLDDALWALRVCPNSDRFSRLLTCEFADMVLPIFETQFPKDSRPRNCIKAARNFALSRITIKELQTARIYADDAAGTAAWAARKTSSASTKKAQRKIIIKMIKESTKSGQYTNEISE